MLCKFVLQKMWWYTSDTSWWIVRNKFFFVLICFLFYLRRLQFSLEFCCRCNFSIITIQLSQFFVQSIKFYQIVLSYRINPRIIEMKMKNSHFNFEYFSHFILCFFPNENLQIIIEVIFHSTEININLICQLFVLYAVRRNCDLLSLRNSKAWFIDWNLFSNMLLSIKLAKN